jgi:1-acyl-sn-glycerol-3-phosphate acyltransferase
VLLTRLPNRFVAPRPDPGTAVASVASLAAGLGDHDALVLFPEGANFTERRRARAIERLRRLGLRHHAARAERMRHVLPPRTGGALAAIEAAPGADVVFVAHSGLDELNSVADIWAALPMDEVIQARWWRVRGEHIPRGEAEREDWLYTWWHRMDDWIDACKTGTAPEQTGPPPAGIDRFTER